METFLVRHALYQLGVSLLSIRILCLLVLGAMSTPTPMSAEERYCDPELTRNVSTDHPLGYRIRGDRCEGIYIQELSSTTLHVVSWTESFEDYDLASGKDLRIEWEAPGANNVQLRGHALRRKLYYRMDTIRPPGYASYMWPSHILAALNISKQEVGVVGWTQYAVGEIERNVYLPLRISQQHIPVRSGHYQLLLVPGRELTEVFVSLAKVGADGHPESVLKNGEPLGYGYYPAERSITVPISNLEASGIYYLEIGAMLRGGGASTVDFWFFHSGN